MKIGIPAEYRNRERVSVIKYLAENAGHRVLIGEGLKKHRPTIIVCFNAIDIPDKSDDPGEPPYLLINEDPNTPKRAKGSNIHIVHATSLKRAKIIFDTADPLDLLAATELYRLIYGQR